MQSVNGHVNFDDFSEVISINLSTRKFHDLSGVLEGAYLQRCPIAFIHYRARESTAGKKVV